jgi:hypothetical protein
MIIQETGASHVQNTSAVLGFLESQALRHPLEQRDTQTATASSEA